MKRRRVFTKSVALMVMATFGLAVADAGPDAKAVRTLDQGADWTNAARLRFYGQDQGSELIPLAWLQALRQPDGTPFLAESFARYGYLPNPDPNNTVGLPIGFTHAASAQGEMVGMTCAACHVRRVDVGGQSYRIDGGPAFADFGAFVADLDAAVGRVLATDAAFGQFAEKVLGARAADPVARDILHAEVRLWSTRFHILVAGTLPRERPWGPTRLDAIAAIYNSLAGLDVGPAPTYLLPDNLQPGDAPTRYPFLWNATRQDITQWTGVAENGNEVLALARSLSEIYGVFGRFHPRPATNPTTGVNRDYLSDNSTSFAGLAALEGLVGRIGPPVWPWAIDRTLAARGKAIFERPTADGGCVACHGKRKGLPRPPNLDTWATPLRDVGTDTRAWRVLLRSAATGSLEGASVPTTVAPLHKVDLALNLLKVSILGTIADYRAAEAPPPAPAARMEGAMREPKKDASGPAVDVYEARVLEGVWAAAPFLHNGSVPTLADLLKPARERPRAFRIGPAYDIAKVGLAVDQPASSFTLATTGCDDRNSGDSRCGHEYGTQLPAGEKAALIEYMKSL